MLSPYGGDCGIDVAVYFRLAILRSLLACRSKHFI
jgi:hypothetical protein